MRKVYGWALLCLFLAPGSILASSINLGFISYDVLIPTVGTQPGVNALNLYNFTGSSSLPPDFPIQDDLTFQNLSVTINTSGGSQVIDLADMGPGPNEFNPALQFASDIAINSVTLSGLLNQTSLFISGSGRHTATSNVVLYQLLSFNGTALEANIDLGVFTIDTITAVPEPSTWLFLTTALIVLLWRGRGLCN